MDRFTSMNVFVRVVEKGSFAAAAEVSGMTSTMVGNHIRYLENLLGVRLLARTTRRHTLTETGHDYYQQCLQILDLLEKAELSAREMRQRPRGRLRVTAPISFGSACLAPALVDYVDRYPEVFVELILDDRILDISKDGIDAAIRIGPLADSFALTAKPLKPWRRIFCASPDYLSAYGVPSAIDEIGQHRCLSFDYSIGPERDYHLVSKTGETAAIHVEPHVSINNGHALIAAATSGLGIILQPEELVRRHLADGTLTHILQDWSTPALPLHVVYGVDRQITPKLKTFIQFMIEHFA